MRARGTLDCAALGNAGVMQRRAGPAAQAAARAEQGAGGAGPALAWVHKGHMPGLAKARQPGAVGRKLDKPRRPVGGRRQAGRPLALHAGLAVIPVAAPPGSAWWAAQGQMLLPWRLNVLVWDGCVAAGRAGAGDKRAGKARCPVCWVQAVTVSWVVRRRDHRRRAAG